MEFVFEFISGLIFEGSIGLAENRKVSKWIRYPIIVIMSLFMISIIVLIGFVGIQIILSKESNSLYCGLVLFAVDIMFIIFGMKKVIRWLKLR